MPYVSSSHTERLVSLINELTELSSCKDIDVTLYVLNNVASVLRIEPEEFPCYTELKGHLIMPDTEKPPCVICEAVRTDFTNKLNEMIRTSTDGGPRNPLWSIACDRWEKANTRLDAVLAQHPHRMSDAS